VDLGEFHRTHGRQYIALYVAQRLYRLVYNFVYGYFDHVPEQCSQIAATAPPLLTAIVAYLFPIRAVQTVCAAIIIILTPIYFYFGQAALS
jgi:hypothetical protein